MLGRLVTMIAGRTVARHIGGAVAGPAGLVVGALLPTVLRRLGPAGMVAAMVGSYAVRKMSDKHRKAEAGQPR